MKKEKRNTGAIIIGIFLVVIMIGSVAGIIGIFSEDNAAKPTTYNGFEFTQTQNGVTTKINGQDYAFVLAPDVVATMKLPTNFKDWNKFDKIYLSADPTTRMSAAFQEFTRFRPVYGISSGIPACYEDSDECQLNNYPLKDCSDASSTVAIILLRETQYSNVSMEGNCLVIEGSVLDAVRYFDRAAYERLGVLQ